MTSKTDQCNTVQAINWALQDAMEKDPTVVVLGEEVGDEQGGGVVKVTAGLSTRFGRSRVRSTPISEMGFVGAAVGAAIAGLKPVVEVMLMNFTAVCMDQITNHAAKLRFMSGGQTHVPMVIRTMTGAGFSSGGQHSDFLEAWFCHTPGMKVVCPSNPADAYGLMLSAIDDPDPVLFIEQIANYWTPGPAPERGKPIELGKAKVVRTGKDVTLIGYARGIVEALPVVDKLTAEGVSVEVIDLRTVNPWDEEAVFASVAKTGRAVIVHEAVKAYGAGAEIAARLYERLFRSIKAPIERVAAQYSPVPVAKSLELAYLFSRADIESAVRRTLEG
jgi:acetoin:2,6-dichlorophenolindophenol oxidoreductase subunit beta